MILKSSLILSGISYDQYRKDLDLYCNGVDNHELNYDEKLIKHVVNSKQIIANIEAKLKDQPFSKINTDKDLILFTISEFWCGDASNIIPFLNIFTKRSERIQLSLVFRDQNESLINQFLTNGGKSIPKVILLNAETSEVISSWGPRPKMMQDFYQKTKDQKLDYKDWWPSMQTMYDNDFGKAIIKEIEELIDSSNSL